MRIGLYKDFKRPEGKTFVAPDGVEYTYVAHEAYRMRRYLLDGKIERSKRYPVVYWGMYNVVNDPRAVIGGGWEDACANWIAADPGDGSEFARDVRRDLQSIALAMATIRTRCSWLHELWLHFNVPVEDPEPDHDKEFWRRIRFRMEQLAALRPDVLLIRPCDWKGDGAEAPDTVYKALKKFTLPPQSRLCLRDALDAEENDD